MKKAALALLACLGLLLLSGAPFLPRLVQIEGGQVLDRAPDIAHPPANP